MKFPARMPRRSKTLRVCSEVVALGGRVRRHVGPSRRLRPLKASGSRWRAPLASEPNRSKVSESEAKYFALYSVGAEAACAVGGRDFPGDIARAPSPGWQVAKGEVAKREVAKREVETEGKSDELAHQRKIVVAVDLLPW
jgi:hypothetical protein